MTRLAVALPRDRPAASDTSCPGSPAARARIGPSPDSDGTTCNAPARPATATSPSRSVRNDRAPRAVSKPRVAAEGWP